VTVEKLLERLNVEHAHRTLALDHAKTLILLRALKAGEITIEDVVLTADGWHLNQTPPFVRETPPAPNPE
jgi:hypothetical protein